MKHIHFIGICGVAMSALAIAFQKLGYKVTGSDKGFYPPVSDNLREAGINFYPGWHPEKMTAESVPDLVVVGNVAGSKNPELLYIKENNIPYKSYPEVVAEFLIKEKSIVCAGTYGKSTTSTLMTWILTQNNEKINHMFGGISINDLAPANIQEDSQWSVVEGDEYKTSRWDNSPKFAHYSPSHLLLTSIVWDHADVYPTEEKYIEAFIGLANSINEDGVMVISEKALSVIGDKISGSYISYGKEKDNDFQYTDVVQTKEKLSFKIINNGSTYNIESPIIGEYNADNITGCFAMAITIGMKPENIISTINTFKGMKRRLQKRSLGVVDVYDDIAHSPSKATAVLKTLKNLYKGRVVAVFEPNTGNRRSQSEEGYADAFINADEVIIPRLTKLKVDPNDSDKPMNGEQLADIISKTQKNVKYIDGDEELVKYIRESTKDGDVVVFLGSHSFRNMIEQVVDKLS